MKEDKNKAIVLNRIVRTELFINPKDGIPFALQSLQLSQKVNWKKGSAIAHNNFGLLVGDTGNNTLAREHFEKSLQLNKELDAKFDIINNLNNIGRSYQRESDFTRASENYFAALSIAEAINNPEQI